MRYNIYITKNQGVAHLKKIVHKTQKQVMVSIEIMKSLNFSIEQLQSCIAYLGDVLGARLKYIIPDRINDSPTLQWIIRLSEDLKKLEGFEGFKSHINTYARTQVESSYFVTVVARYLSDKGVDDIIFDPQITVTGRKPDILVTYRGEQVYIECKVVSTAQFDYSKEHNHMLSILRNYIDVPHQLDIRYRKSLSDTELHNLGKVLQQRLNKVKGDGKIIDNENLEVGVLTRESYQAGTTKLVLGGGIMQDTNAKCNYPLSLCGIDGHSVLISGPKVDYSKILRSKIKRSRRQSPDNNPYLLMVDGNSMLGSLNDNIRAVSSAFQPETNTRFSGATLVTYYESLGSVELDFKFYFVPNPFAKFPVSKAFTSLFSSSSED